MRKGCSPLCETHGLDDIEALADEIIDRSEHATRASIQALPAGTYNADAVLDLADASRINIVCSLEVDPVAGEITVDYEGSSEASPWGINVVMNYTHAYYHLHRQIGPQPRHPQQSRQPRPDQGQSPRRFNRQRGYTPAGHGAPCSRHVLAQRAA